MRGSVLRWAPRLAALLVLAALALASVAGVTQARYLTSDSAAGSARVAKWDVEVTNQGFSESVYSFTVENKGEVAADCTVVLELPKGLPDTVTVGFAATGVGPSTVKGQPGGTLSFPIGTLAPGGTVSCRVEFFNLLSGDQSVSFYGAEVYVSAVQVD